MAQAPPPRGKHADVYSKLPNLSRDKGRQQSNREGGSETHTPKQAGGPLDAVPKFLARAEVVSNSGAPPGHGGEGRPFAKPGYATPTDTLIRTNSPTGEANPSKSEQTPYDRELNELGRLCDLPLNEFDQGHLAGRSGGFDDQPTDQPSQKAPLPGRAASERGGNASPRPRGNAIHTNSGFAREQSTDTSSVHARPPALIQVPPSQSNPAHISIVRPEKQAGRWVPPVESSLFSTAKSTRDVSPEVPEQAGSRERASVISALPRKASAGGGMGGMGFGFVDESSVAQPSAHKPPRFGSSAPAEPSEPAVRTLPLAKQPEPGMGRVQGLVAALGYEWAGGKPAPFRRQPSHDHRGGGGGGGGLPDGASPEPQSSVSVCSGQASARSIIRPIEVTATNNLWKEEDYPASLTATGTRPSADAAGPPNAIVPKQVGAAAAAAGAGAAGLSAAGGGAGGGGGRVNVQQWPFQVTGGGARSEEVSPEPEEREDEDDDEEWGSDEDDDGESCEEGGGGGGGGGGGQGGVMSIDGVSVTVRYSKPGSGEEGVERESVRLQTARKSSLGAHPPPLPLPVGIGATHRAHTHAPSVGGGASLTTSASLVVGNCATQGRVVGADGLVEGGGAEGAEGGSGSLSSSSGTGPGSLSGSPATSNMKIPVSAPPNMHHYGGRLERQGSAPTGREKGSRRGSQEGPRVEHRMEHRMGLEAAAAAIGDAFRVAAPEGKKGLRGSARRQPHVSGFNPAPPQAEFYLPPSASEEPAGVPGAEEESSGMFTGAGAGAGGLAQTAHQGSGGGSGQQGMPLSARLHSHLPSNREGEGEREGEQQQQPPQQQQPQQQQQQQQQQRELMSSQHFSETSSSMSGLGQVEWECMRTVWRGLRLASVCLRLSLDHDGRLRLSPSGPEAKWNGQMDLFATSAGERVSVQKQRKYNKLLESDGSEEEEEEHRQQHEQQVDSRSKGRQAGGGNGEKAAGGRTQPAKFANRSTRHILDVASIKVKGKAVKQHGSSSSSSGGGGGGGGGGSGEGKGKEKDKGKGTMRMQFKDGVVLKLTGSGVHMAGRALEISRQAWQQRRRWQARHVAHKLQMAKTKVVWSNAAHRSMMQAFWATVYPDLPMPEPTLDIAVEGWKNMGFQSNDPCTDFRAMGLLGLHCLLYLASHYPERVRSIIRDGAPKRDYPYGSVGINVVATLVEMLGLGRNGAGLIGGGAGEGDDEVSEQELQAVQGSKLFDFFCRLPPDAPPAGPTPKGAREYGGKEEGEWMVHGNANALEETFCAAYEMLDNMWVHEPPANILFFNETLKKAGEALKDVVHTHPLISLSELRARTLLYAPFPSALRPTPPALLPSSSPPEPSSPSAHSASGALEPFAPGRAAKTLHRRGASMMDLERGEDLHVRAADLPPSHPPQPQPDARWERVGGRRRLVGVGGGAGGGAGGGSGGGGDLLGEEGWEGGEEALLLGVEGKGKEGKGKEGKGAWGKGKPPRRQSFHC